MDYEILLINKSPGFYKVIKSIRDNKAKIYINSLYKNYSYERAYDLLHLYIYLFLETYRYKLLVDLLSKDKDKIDIFINDVYFNSTNKKLSEMDNLLICYSHVNNNYTHMITNSGKKIR